MSASNTDYSSVSTQAYGDVSFFYGLLTYDTTISPNPWIEICKQVTRAEQTKVDGTVTRIEPGRQLIVTYDSNGGRSKVQTITIQGSLSGLVMSLSTTVLASYMLAF